MNSWIGLTVAQALTQCGTPYDEVELVDEPPGKLRELVFICRSETPPRKVVVTLDYDSTLFSGKRDWPRSLVESRKITAVRDAK
jgi:hypothetical protein